jgi:hypothetical protein
VLKTETTTIDGILFTTTQLPAMRGFELLARLVKMIGPALGALTSADPTADLSAMAPALAGALTNINPQEASALVVDIFSCTTALISDSTGGRQVQLSDRTNIDLVFSSRLKVMFQVLAHAIKVNFGDFSGGSAPAAPLPPAPSGS